MKKRTAIQLANDCLITFCIEDRIVMLSRYPLTDRLWRRLALFIQRN